MIDLLPQTAMNATIQAEPAALGFTAASCLPWTITKPPTLKWLPYQTPSSVDSGLGGTIGFSDPLASYRLEQAQQQLRIEQARVAATARVNELKLEAIRTYNWVSRSSLEDLQVALRSIAFTRRPAIFLLENGNFRVMWKNPAREQVAVQFLGGKNAQFVIFALDARGIMTRLAGITVIDRLGALIAASRASNLLS
jgi:hypothetical protein